MNIQIQITQISNGFVVAHPPIRNIRMNPNEPPQPITHYTETIEGACEYIKETFKEN